MFAGVLATVLAVYGILRNCYSGTFKRLLTKLLLIEESALNKVAVIEAKNGNITCLRESHIRGVQLSGRWKYHEKVISIGLK